MGAISTCQSPEASGSLKTAPLLALNAFSLQGSQQPAPASIRLVPRAGSAKALLQAAHANCLKHVQKGPPLAADRPLCTVEEDKVGALDTLMPEQKLGVAPTW